MTFFKKFGPMLAGLLFALVLGFLLSALVGCGPTAAPTDANGQPIPQQAGSSVNPWLAGGLGFLAGRMMGGGGSHTTVVHSVPAPPTTVINRTVINKTVVNHAPVPTTTPKVTAPMPTTKPPAVNLSRASSYRPPSRSFSGGRSFGRR